MSDIGSYTIGPYKALTSNNLMGLVKTSITHILGKLRLPHHKTGLILGLQPGNERRRCNNISYWLVANSELALNWNNPEWFV